jgi:hypothetical protein
VFETDDDYTGRYRHIHDYTCQHFARCVDYITVSTPYLGKLLHEESGKPYYVLPNSIEFEMFADRQTNTERQVPGINSNAGGNRYALRGLETCCGRRA